MKRCFDVLFILICFFNDNLYFVSSCQPFLEWDFYLGSKSFSEWDFYLGSKSFFNVNLLSLFWKGWGLMGGAGDTCFA